MAIILKIKNWQIFPILLVGYLMTVFSIENEVFLTLLINIIGIFIIFGWLLFLGLSLSKISKNDNTFFTVNALIVIISIIIFRILGKGEDYEVEGIVALPLFYIMYALIYVFAYPMKLLKSIELKREVKFKDYWYLFFLMIFWIIGVWIVQPKLNRIINEENKF